MSDEEELRIPISELVTVTIQRNEVTTVRLEIPFYNETDAIIAYNSLRIDKEPPRGNVSKELSVICETLLVANTGVKSFLHFGKTTGCSLACSVFLYYPVFVNEKVLGRQLPLVPGRNSLFSHFYIICDFVNTLNKFGPSSNKEAEEETE
ncbi:unnamed protein product [Larinioides sclopetarius]|uniref:Uncharacterized protein n=1 Tax=Larinioides sclopetarius TaxID=280406 RepID=A0AAV2BQV2_9ARAC